MWPAQVSCCFEVAAVAALLKLQLLHCSGLLQPAVQVHSCYREWLGYSGAVGVWRAAAVFGGFGSQMGMKGGRKVQAKVVRTTPYCYRSAQQEAAMARGCQLRRVSLRVVVDGFVGARTARQDRICSRETRLVRAESAQGISCMIYESSAVGGCVGVRAHAPSARITASPLASGGSTVVILYQHHLSHFAVCACMCPLVGTVHREECLAFVVCDAHRAWCLLIACVQSQLAVRSALQGGVLTAGARWESLLV